MRHTFSMRQIEGFLLASELRSFSRAAEAMGITQSAFSQLIREFETSLEVRLFDRTTRRIVMTAAGEAMYRKASTVIKAIDEACEEAQAIARMERGHITLGSISSLAPGIVTRALGRLRQEYPGVTVTLQEGLNDVLIQRVANGQLELAVCVQVGETPELSFRPLFEDEMVVVLPDSYKFSEFERMKWTDLDNNSLISSVKDASNYKFIERIIATKKITLGSEYEAATLLTALSMVRAGFGFTFMPEIVRHDMNMEGLVDIRIEDPPVRRVGLYRQYERVASPIANKFEELVRVEISSTRAQQRRKPTSHSGTEIQE